VINHPNRLKRPVFIKDPLVIMCSDDDNNVTCVLGEKPGMDHRAYGLLICDLVRHVSNCYKVTEADVWEWVDKERHHNTTDITTIYNKGSH
jgi:hypothetical protein